MAKSYTYKLGVVYNADDLSLAEMLHYARLAEEAGVESVWTVEAGRDAFVPLTAMASVLQRARVGTSVAQFARPPVLTALSALALAEYTHGRFVLGIGTGPLDWNKQWHGLEVPKPVARMREYIECLRTLWTATTTQPVSYSGEFIQVKDYVRFIPAAYDRVPIYLGGVNRLMIQLAGSHADGLILGGINTPKYITEVVHPNLHRGLQRAGRSRHDVELCMLKICAVNTDAQAARALARSAVAFTASLVYYDVILDPMGFTDAARAIRAALARNDIPGMLSAVTDEMVAALTVAGTPDEVRRQLGQFAGLVDTVILCSPYFAGDLEAVKANHQAMIEMLRTM